MPICTKLKGLNDLQSIAKWNLKWLINDVIQRICRHRTVQKVSVHANEKITYVWAYGLQLQDTDFRPTFVEEERISRLLPINIEMHNQFAYCSETLGLQIAKYFYRKTSRPDANTWTQLKNEGFVMVYIAISSSSLISEASNELAEHWKDTSDF